MLGGGGLNTETKWRGGGVQKMQSKCYLLFDKKCNPHVTYCLMVLKEIKL